MTTVTLKQALKVKDVELVAGRLIAIHDGERKFIGDVMGDEVVLSAEGAVLVNAATKPVKTIADADSAPALEPVELPTVIEPGLDADAAPVAPAAKPGGGKRSIRSGAATK